MRKKTVLLLALMMTLLCWIIAPGFAQPVTIATSSYLSGNPTVYNDSIAFVSDTAVPELMYYTISTAALVPTGVSNAYFPSIYQGNIAFATFVSPPVPWQTYIGIYHIGTGLVTMILQPDPGDIFDIATWNAGDASAVSFRGNIIGFYDHEGVWYYDIAAAGWTSLSASIGGTKFGISVCGNIITWSEGAPGLQTIRYHDVSTGITINTGINGVHPSICHNVIAFDWGNTILYYDIAAGALINTGAAGIQPWIWSNLIAFTTNEAWVGMDLNGDGDMVDDVIRYYNTSTGMVTNTGDVGMFPSLWGRAAFITRELDLGVDVNGDGDLTDWAARFITIRIPGDINNDGIVNILDASAVSAHWYPGPPIGPSGYDPVADINCDGQINILDMAIVSAYWTGPPKGPLDP